MLTPVEPMAMRGGGDVRHRMAAAAFPYVVRPRSLDRCGGIHLTGVHAGGSPDMGSPGREPRRRATSATISFRLYATFLFLSAAQAKLARMFFVKREPMAWRVV